VFNGVPAVQVQALLREWFACWGLPQAVRVDNGAPWGGRYDLPPDLALWVLGLGVEVRWNPPRQPRYNAVVERSHGVSQRWAEVERCASAEELQRRLDDLDVIQRQEYQALNGRTRWQVYPDLGRTRRPYRPADEAGAWRLAPVLDYLAGLSVRRKVDGQGKVSVYNRPLAVGVRQAGRPVWLHLDPAERAWVVADEHGRQLRVQPAGWLTPENVRALQVTAPRRGGRQNLCPN
jgi:hypothetical protein